MKTFIQHIVEKRSHAELNPKVSINQIIKDAVETTKSKIAGVQNLFISMTRIEKIGINPKSKYNTPLGIFCYPAEYVRKKVGDDKSLANLPYVGEPDKSPFVNIFSVKGNIINLNTMTETQYNGFMNKMIEILAKTQKIPIDDARIIAKIFNVMANKKSFVKTPGGRFWFMTLAMFQEINGYPDVITTGGRPGIKSITQWNRLFLDLGIDGCVDPKDEGIIHFNEPTQAVFFNPRSIINNKRYANKYSPDVMDRRLGDKLERIGNARMSDDEIIRLLKVTPQAFVDMDVKSLSENVLVMLFGRLFYKSIISKDYQEFDVSQLTPKVLKAMIDLDPVSIAHINTFGKYKKVVTPDLVLYAANDAIKTYKDVGKGGYSNSFDSGRTDHFNFFDLVRKTNQWTYEKLIKKFPQMDEDIRNDAANPDP